MVEEVKESKKQVRKPVVKMTAVRTMQEKDGRALVEWVNRKGMLESVFVGVDEVKDGKVASGVLAEAIPYGVPWEDLFAEVQKVTTPKVRANELRKVGIWTLDDLRTKSRFVLGALKAGLRVEIGELHKFATKLKEGGDK